MNGEVPSVFEFKRPAIQSLSILIYSSTNSKSTAFERSRISRPARAKLVSRNGNKFHGFRELATWIAAHLRVESAVLDGEIACVDDCGWPIFRDLLFRKSQCV